MLLALFKIVGGILCLFANLTILLRSGSIEDVVKDYVAVAIIASIDNMIGETFKRPGLKLNLNVFISIEENRKSDSQVFNEQILNKKKFCETICSRKRSDHGPILAIEEALKNGKFKKNLKCWKKIFFLLFMIFFRLFSILYTVIYYYFAPFLVTVFIVYSQVSHDEN